MVLQPMGCGRVGHRHNTPTQAARDLYSLWPLLCALNAISACRMLSFLMSLSTALVTHTNTTASSSNTANPTRTSLTRTSLTHPRYGWQHPWADKRTQQFDPRPHDPQVACNSDDRTFRGTPTNVAIPTTSFQTLGTRLGELHATFPRHHNIRHRKGLQRHYAQPSVRNPQRLEDAYDTRNPGSLTRPRVQPRHEDTNDAG